MASRFLAFVSTAMLGLAGHAAVAQDSPAANTPPVMGNLSGCQAISTAPQRLECFDAAARAIDEAMRNGDLVVVDRTQATAARRQAFGTNSAPVDILQPVQGTDRIDRIETTLTRASQAGDGRWTFVLDDGSIWTQVDTDRVQVRNRAGETVRIRRAALGSYLLVVGQSGAVRVRRQ